MFFSNEWPLYYWHIKHLQKVDSLKSAEISVKDIKFQLILEKIRYLNSAYDSLELHLQEMHSNRRHLTNFLVRISIKNMLGDSYFLQKSEFVKRQFVSSQCIWKVRVDDLFKEPDFDLDESVIFVCTFGRENEYPYLSEDRYFQDETGCSYCRSLENLSIDFSVMLNHPSKTDVVITCGKPEEHIHAHESVLSVRSPVFFEMFQKDLLISTPRIIKIDEIDPVTFKRFLTYLYTGKILNMNINNDWDLYVIGHKYKVRSLMAECTMAIIQRMTVHLAYRFLPLADEYSDGDFKYSLIDFIVDKDVLRSDPWFRFSEQYPDLSIEVYFSFLCRFLEMHKFSAFSTDLEISMEFEKVMSN